MAIIDLDIKIKQALQTWRERNYEGTSPFTMRLLEFWFKEEHILPDGSHFEFWRCQREGIEALIYAYEICKYHSLYDLARGFGVSIPVDPTKDLWTKYCFKMATGSGKTWVMALTMVWQYFNKIFGTNNGVRYSGHFLLLAPNLIVLDRLKEAFGDNRVFRDFPFIPPELQVDFELQLISQSEVIPRTARGILHLTNIQQLYEREAEGVINPLVEVLGPKPKREEEAIYDSLRMELTSYDDLMVLNDEAHHVHSDDLEWNKVIAYLNSTYKERKNEGLVMQLDFTATPKDLQGSLFPHIIYDYPLAEAIKDKIVKRPRIGEIENIPEPLGKDFVKRNRLQIDTGVEILKEFQKEFKDTGKKPVLFIMTDITKNADKVGQYLGRQGYAGKVLVIHTDNKGFIKSKKDIEEAREAARKIDSPGNPYEIIISVMMLKEGWDVRNVCVIVPLRAFDSPVLPEQTLGRGLRRMAPQDETWEERLIVIDHPRFRQLWQAEIDKGELIVDFTSAKRAYEPSNLVLVNPEKLQYDIKIPVVEGGLTRTVPDLARLDITRLPSRLFRLSEIEIPKVMYRERDLLEQKIVREKILAFDYTENFSLYLSYICKAITSKTGASSIFPELVPKVKTYIENYLFDQKVDGEDLEVTKKLNYIPIREKLVEIFAREINTLSKKEEKVSIPRYFKVGETQPLHTSEPVAKVKKAVFEALPYSKRSAFEKEFMGYLDEKGEVQAFTKVLSRHPLHIPYYNQEGYLRYYQPDFVVKEREAMYLIETKGMEGAEVPIKDREALRWCESVGKLSGKSWKYLKVRPQDLETCRAQNFRTLAKGTEVKD